MFSSAYISASFHLDTKGNRPLLAGSGRSAQDGGVVAVDVESARTSASSGDITGARHGTSRSGGAAAIAESVGAVTFLTVFNTS
jgi:hypothetical protein